MFGFLCVTLFLLHQCKQIVIMRLFFAIISCFEFRVSNCFIFLFSKSVLIVHVLQDNVILSNAFRYIDLKFAFIGYFLSTTRLIVTL